MTTILIVDLDVSAKRGDSDGVRSLYEAFGVSFALDLFDRSLVERVEALLPSATVVGPSTRAQGIPDTTSEELAVYTLSSHGDGVYRVHQGDREALASRDLELAVWTLGGLARDYIAFHATVGIFVRGAAVLLDGRAIVVIGPPLSGRTTLAQALVQAGASAWSDEYVVFDEAGQVGRFGEASPAAASPGGPHPGNFVPLGIVVVTSFRPDVSWNPAEGSEGDAVLAMLAQAIPARDRSAQTMAVLRRAVSGVTTLRGDRGDATATAKAIVTVASKSFASGPLSG